MNKGILIVIVAVLGALAIWAFSQYGGDTLETEFKVLAAIEDPAERIEAVLAFGAEQTALDMDGFATAAAMIAEAADELGELRAIGYVDTVLLRQMPDGLRSPLTAELHDLIMMRLYYGPDDELAVKADAVATHMLHAEGISGNAFAVAASMRSHITENLLVSWPTRVPDPWLTLALAERSQTTGDDIERWYRGALGQAYGSLLTVAGRRRGEEVELAMIDSLLSVAPDAKHEYFLHVSRFNRTLGVSDADAVRSAQAVSERMEEHGDATTLNVLGYALAESDLAPGLAVAICVQALELAETARDSVPILDSVGWAYHKAGDQVEAARAIEKSLALHRASPAYGQSEVSHLLAVYDASDDTEAAITFLASMVARSTDDTTEARAELGSWLDRSGQGRATLNDVVTAHRYSGVVYAPEFALVSEEGERLALADCRGKIVFLNFWRPG